MSEAPAVETLSGNDLVGTPVRWHGVRVGRAADVLFDLGVRRVLGVEVDCGNGERRFLALAACELSAGGIALVSPHAMVDAAGLSFYRDHSRSLGALLGSVVYRRGNAAGVLEDLALLPNGDIERVVLRRGGGSRVSLPPHELDWERSHE
jgi:hypothetical protein